MRELLLLRRGTRLVAARPVEARMVVHHRVVDHRPVHIHVRHMHTAKVVHRAVVREAIADPLAATEAEAAIAKPIVHAAIEAYVRPPIALVKPIHPTRKPPVRRRPKHTLARRLHPHTRNPVVPARPVRPVPRRPKIALRRNRRLHVNRKRRRRNPHRNENTSVRDRGSRDHRRPKNQFTKCPQRNHDLSSFCPASVTGDGGRTFSSARLSENTESSV